MNILVLGGDGYLGWPTAMHLSDQGHQVCVVDNYLRRRLCLEEDVEALCAVPNLSERTRIWKEKTGNEIEARIGDLNDWGFISRLFRETAPDTIIHFAEQPSAPYSMLRRDSATLTLTNNIGATSNVIFAAREYCPDAHIIKLGTMGEYGTPDIDIEEGWLDITHNGRSDRFLYPRQAGSLYHTTKIMDTDLLWFYVRTWDLRVTDLMQGPVYGIITGENKDIPELLPFLNYDELFGTVLNRFLVQAVARYPLTVYGKGGQTRGYINLKDTLSCIRLAVDNPPAKGKLDIFNQFTETFNVRELADRVQSVGQKLGLDVHVQEVPNPRQELEEHYYNPSHSGLVELGLKPNFLTDEVMAEMLEFIIRNRDGIDIRKIFNGEKWS